MSDPFKDVAEFHRKFGLEYEGKPRALPRALQAFRDKFHREELREYGVATQRLARLLAKQEEASIDDEVALELSHALDALVDEMYVLLGTAYLHGFDFNAAWDRVHAANMAKVRAQRAADSKRKSRFDVVKPPGWQPPRIQPLVSDHAHQ